MRILYLADIRFPLERANGIQTMETCAALAARGHDVSLAVRPDSHRPARDPFVFYGLPRNASLHVELAAIGGPPPARRAGYVTFAIGRALGRVRQDVIFTRDLGIAAILVRLPRLLRAAVVYEAHTIAADEAAARHRMLTGAAPAAASKLRRLAARDEAVWRAADGYVTITAGLKTELERRFGPRNNVAVVPDGVRVASKGTTEDGAAEHIEHTAHSERDQTDPRPLTIGYAGHLYPWKGVDLLVEAVAALPGARALIVGGHEQEPDLARVRQFAADLDCAARITFTGLVPPPDVAARLAEADVLVLPNPASAVSTAFTSPLKLFEYMASGRPIVASDLPSIREILADGRNALLVPAGNPPALAAAIRRLRDDPALRDRLAAQARQDARDYTWEKRAERLEALFDEVRR